MIKKKKEKKRKRKGKKKFLEHLPSFGVRAIS
jgi:hypothetical protein